MRTPESTAGTITPAEAAAVTNRLARMNPRFMPPQGPLATLRTLDHARLIYERRATATAGRDTTLVEAELECRRAISRIRERIRHS